MDLEKLPERAFAWVSRNRMIGGIHERLRATGEAFVLAAMTRPSGAAWDAKQGRGSRSSRSPW